MLSTMVVPYWAIKNESPPVDGSRLVTSGRQQPTATIEALAYRTADYIQKAAKRNEI